MSRNELLIYVIILEWEFAHKLLLLLFRVCLEVRDISYLLLFCLKLGVSIMIRNLLSSEYENEILLAKRNSESNKREVFRYFLCDKLKKGGISFEKQAVGLERSSVCTAGTSER